MIIIMLNYGPKYLFLMFLILSIQILSSCEKESGDRSVIITVSASEGNTPVQDAFLIEGEDLLGISDENGHFDEDILDPGTYTLICSALGFTDGVQEVNVKQEGDTRVDFMLIEDQQTGRFYGELLDLDLFMENLETNPEMAQWTEKEIYDGITGATIKFDYDEPSAQVYLVDSLLSYSDGYGQFWFDLQAGTYPLKVTCPGYRDTLKIIEVVPDIRSYLIFYLEK